ncbi:hypothetical protein B7494_g2271 [Chlorociboria aeruginascens]|nr:hypothetical protein B7494_g2271 [Chlorociboria aeruginascens]
MASKRNDDEFSPVPDPYPEMAADGASDEGMNSDDELLRSIGYKQEFRREFTRLSTLSFAISIMGVLGSVPATYAVPLASGGPSTAIWAWFTGSFFSMCIALSSKLTSMQSKDKRDLNRVLVAELVSAYPTAGGMYFVTKYVVPEGKVPLASWVVGWSNFLGQTAGVTSVCYSVGQMLLAAVAMASDFDEETGKTAKHTVAATSATEVFGNVTDGSNWNSKGFSFMIGFLSVAWTMTDYDATTHISEEMKEAAIRGPVAITQAVIISGIVGWMLNVTFGFCIGDVAATLSSGLGNPVAQLFFNAHGRKSALAMWFWVILIQFFAGCAAMLADTRMAYAFSRDHALPFSNTLKSISPITKTPLGSVWLVVFLCCCLSLIALGNVETVNSIFGITAPSLDCSYMAVIFFKLYSHDKIHIRKGPFSLGKYDRSQRLISMALAIFALSWWYAGAKKVYIGPRVRPFRPEKPEGLRYLRVPQPYALPPRKVCDVGGIQEGWSSERAYNNHFFSDKTPGGEIISGMELYDTKSPDAWMSEKFATEYGLQNRPKSPEDIFMYRTFNSYFMPDKDVEVEIKDSGRDVHRFEKFSFNTSPSLDGISIILGRIFIFIRNMVSGLMQRNVEDFSLPHAKKLATKDVIETANQQANLARSILASSPTSTTARTSDTGSSQTATETISSSCTSISSYPNAESSKKSSGSSVGAA